MPFTRSTLEYQDSIDWLYSTQTFGIKLGLENTKRLLAELKIETSSKVVHVAGTNGKGSVCAFAEKILRDGGLRTGLFTSPHLISYRERIRVSGDQISEIAVAETLTTIRSLVGEWEQHPTFFEISLVLAMQHFAEEDCDVILLETGMGGRFDATSAIAADVSVITSISLDHQQWLGETIKEIAGEKAGIIKPDTPVIVADLHPDARDVVGRRALALRVPCIEVHPLPEEWPLGLAGPHQRENAALAVEAACRIEGDRLTQDSIRDSLATTSWPGRFQKLNEKVFIDGAHNPRAASTLRDTWEETFPGERAHLVFGVAEQKDVVGIFRELAPIISSISFVPIKSERRATAEALSAAWQDAGRSGDEVIPVSDLDVAIESAVGKETKTLVAGSLFLVGEVLSLVEGGIFEKSEQ